MTDLYLRVQQRYGWSWQVVASLTVYQLEVLGFKIPTVENDDVS